MFKKNDSANDRNNLPLLRKRAKRLMWIVQDAINVAKHFIKDPLNEGLVNKFNVLLLFLLQNLVKVENTPSESNMYTAMMASLEWDKGFAKFKTDSEILFKAFKESDASDNQIMGFILQDIDDCYKSNEASLAIELEYERLGDVLDDNFAKISVLSSRRQTSVDLKQASPMSSPPSCFISYARGHQPHEKRIQKLAQQLSKAGISVIWYNQFGSIPQYTENVTKVDYVIVVGTPLLKIHWNDKTQPYTEKAELEQISYNVVNKNQNKLIKVLLAGTNETSFPDNLASYTWSATDFTDERDFSGYFNLLAKLYEKDIEIVAEIKALHKDFRIKFNKGNANMGVSELFIGKQPVASSATVDAKQGQPTVLAVGQGAAAASSQSINFTQTFQNLTTNFARLKSSVQSLNLSNKSTATALLKRIAIAETANNRIHPLLSSLTQINQLPISDKKVIEAHCDNIKNQLSVVLKNIQDSEKSLADKAGINAIIDFLQAEIRSIYLTFFPEKGWVIKPEERAKLLQQAQALYKSQQETMKDAHFNQCLEQVQSRALDATNPYSSPKVYFCYAWPHDKYKAEEQWVQDFLKTLKNHLASAGIENTLLDVADNRHGDNIYHFMDQLDDSDYVIVFGTESLLEKHNRGTSALTTELIKLIQKRTKEQEQGLHRVLPILLSGNHQISFPSNYTMYMTIRDWPAKDYVNNFKMLVERLYEVGKNDVDFHKIWQIDAKATNVSSVQFANLTAAAPGSYPGFFPQAAVLPQTGAPAVVNVVKTVDNDHKSQTPADKIPIAVALLHSPH